MDATEDGEFCVALRSALLRDRDAHLFAGVGVVAGSDPAAELAETEIKLRRCCRCSPSDEAPLDLLVAGAGRSVRGRPGRERRGSLHGAGGTGADPCANPAKPCSVYTAAAEGAPHSTLAAGDVVELAPGIYHAEEEGEFGYILPVHLPEGVTVRGEPGKARPVIVVAKEGDSYSSFYVPTGSEVADVEIRNQQEVNGSAIEISRRRR